mgnify:CR=1 FL=1
MLKPVYKNNERIQVALNGDTNNIKNGKIVGISSINIIDMWLVQFDSKLEHYEYDVITIPHTFIRKFGDNKPFICETGLFNEYSKQVS